MKEKEKLNSSKKKISNIKHKCIYFCFGITSPVKQFTYMNLSMYHVLSQFEVKSFAWINMPMVEKINLKPHI